MKSAVILLALVAVTLFAYWGCLRGPFHFDDALFLQSSHVTEPGDPLFLLRPAQLRQLAYLSFYGNYRLAGSDPSSYHLVNLLIHLANAIGVFFLARLLIQRSEYASNSYFERWLPLLATAIFALHPVQSEAVNYVYQRSTLLAGSFSLASLCVFLKAESQPPARALHWASLAFLVLAAMSKESALILPLVLVASLLLLRPADLQKTPTRRTTRLWLLPHLALMVLGAAWALYHLDRSGEATTGLRVSETSPVEYFMSQIQVVVAYLRLLIWPAGLSIDHDPAVAPFTSLYGLACALLLAAILLLALLIRRTHPLWSFLAFAFFIFLAPTSTFIPSADLMFEHRVYLPMIPASIILALIVLEVPRLVLRNQLARRIATCAATALLLLSYTWIARERTFIWGDTVRLWQDAAAKAPRKARVHYNLASAWLGRDIDKARAEFLATLELRPDYAPALYNLGWLEQRAGRYAPARRYYDAALAADAQHWQVLHNLGNLDVLEGKSEDAVRHYTAAIRLRRDNWAAYQSLGAVLIQMNRFRNARGTLGKLKELQPEMLEGRYLLAYAQVYDNAAVEAEAELRQLEAADTSGAFKERIEQLRAVMASRPR